LQALNAKLVMEDDLTPKIQKRYPAKNSLLAIQMPSSSAIFTETPFVSTTAALNPSSTSSLLTTKKAPYKREILMASSVLL